MKILISADMEGISGIVAWPQVTPGHAEYLAHGRPLMAGDVNAAIQGAFEGGADEVVVSDAHEAAGNLLIADLDARVRLNSGSPSPFAMLQSLDDTPGPDGVVFVGYHARAGTKKAVLAHTWSSSTIRALWLNDRPAGEIALNAALAAEYGAPVIALTGDQHACAEAQDLLGPALQIAVVKNATGRYAAQCLPLPEARERICEAAAGGVVRLRQGQAAPAYRLSTPVRLAVEFVEAQHADRAFLIPGTERVDGTRLEYTAPDVVTAHRAFRAMAMLARD